MNQHKISIPFSGQEACDIIFREAVKQGRVADGDYKVNLEMIEGTPQKNGVLLLTLEPKPQDQEQAS